MPKFICYVAEFKFETFDLDKQRCAFINFVLWLSVNHFGYLCVALITLIAVISIFGGIKENYRWFILNQVFWDLLLCFEYIDDNAIQRQFIRSSFRYRGVSQWFPNDFQPLVNAILETQTYSALFLLCATRVFCLFFMNFYEKLTRNRRILYFIFGFNFVTVALNFVNTYVTEAVLAREQYLYEDCKIKAKNNRKQFSKCYDYYKDYSFWPDDFLQNVLNVLRSIFSFIVLFKSTIFLLLSILATILIIFRIAKQASFQLKHNRRDFLNSFRVSLVMVLQTILYSMAFLIYLINFFKTWDNLFSIVISYNGDPCYEDASACIRLHLPVWLYSGTYGLADPRILQTIVQLRIFFECVLVIIIMTGYREAIFKFFRFLFKAAYNPWEMYIKFSSRSSNSSTRVTATFNGSASSKF